MLITKLSKAKTIAPIKNTVFKNFVFAVIANDIKIKIAIIAIITLMESLIGIKVSK